MASVNITSIRFWNFKSLRNYVLSIQDMNVLVGPNNSGKSTIISALRILEVALRRARSKNAERVRIPAGRYGYGHHLSLNQLSVSLENVATDYNSEDSQIEFRLSNRNKLHLYFPSDGGCTLYWETEGTAVTTAGRFVTAFPISVQVVPVLGPLEHNEAYVTEETVRESLSTHRASRHFRNYWRYYPEGWQLFADMIEATWSGMKIQRPELHVTSKQLTMFVSEDRIDREIYWAGFGFQVWCQLLTHISRASGTTLLAIDEPEIYLHPDVQRQLLAILRGLEADVLLATHSVEIISEADPAELLLVQKGKQSAQRLRDVEGMQAALQSIGSAHNVALAQLARTKKIIFVEGLDDFRTLRRFAKLIGRTELAAGSDLTAFESGGFSSWERIRSFAWGVKRAIDAKIKMFAVYDRDYHCQEEISAISTELMKELTDAVILERKEMENYLLQVDVLQRTLDKQLAARNKRLGTSVSASKRVENYLLEITDKERIDAQSQYLAKKLTFHKGSHIDHSTLSKQVMQHFEETWKALPTRLQIVPGKTVLRALREAIQTDVGVNLTDVQIIDEFTPSEVPSDLLSLLARLDTFRCEDT
ncbi:MAG: AAA family ATPase [Burkholderiales bacterium]|nr:AAA family ATPase [Burkholderiales bacterium]